MKKTTNGQSLLGALALSLAVLFTASPLRSAEPHTVPCLGITLMPIPAGTFTMGNPGRNDIDRPPTRVTISQPFWLGRTEVTQGQWKALMGTDVLEQVRWRSGGRWPRCATQWVIRTSASRAGTLHVAVDDDEIGSLFG